MRENAKRILIGISTLILIIIMILFVDVREIYGNLLRISIYGILLFALVYTLSFVFRSVRLKRIFYGLNLQSSFLPLFASFGIGWGINDITPGKFGDLARIEFIHQKSEHISLSKSICGVTIERFLDLLILFSFICFILFFMYINNVKGTTKLNLDYYIVLGSLLLLGSVILLIILFFKTDFILKVTGKISTKLRIRLELFLKNFLEGMNDFRKKKENLFLVFILSIPIWLFETLTLVLLFYLLGFEINFLIIILAQIIVFFSKIFPLTPGGWVISENLGALLIYLFYPSIPFIHLLAIFIIDHGIRTAYVLLYGISSTLTFNFKYKSIKLKHSDNYSR